MTIWGNHSATQYPDLFHAEISGRNAAEVVGDQAWIENDYIPTVQKRGAAVIEARGASSAASAASATIDHTRDWLSRSPEGSWLSMSVCSDGSYGVPEGLISSFPVTTSNGTWEIVQGLEIDDFSAPGSTPARPSWPRSATPSRVSASSEPAPQQHPATTRTPRPLPRAGGAFACPAGAARVSGGG